jgi:hypothetical protein
MILQDIHVMFDGLIIQIKFYRQLINIIGPIMDGLNNPGSVKATPATSNQIPQNPLHKHHSQCL